MADPKEEKKTRKKPDTKAKGKDKDTEDDEDDDAKGSGIIIALVAVLIILIWLTIFAILIKMDVGGFGSTVMYPILKDIPYVNKILPEQENAAPAEQDSAYQFDSMDDAVARIKELEGQVKTLEDEKKASEQNLDTYKQEEAELQQYKENEAAFEKEKSEWYQDIVYNNNAPDPSEYKKYYEEIDPANAEALYKQVASQSVTDAELDNYVKAYSSMKPAEAAGIFDTMTDNLSLVAKILMNMDAESRGNILGQMNADTAAKVTEIMNP